MTVKQGQVCLMAALAAASLTSFLFGYFKYGLKLRRILSAGPTVTTGEELFSLMRNSMKPSFKIPFLGIFYSPACLVKVYGKVVPLATPIKTLVDIKKGHAQTIHLQVDTVIEQVSHLKNGKVVSQACLL
jgi:hypothetical protein